MPTQILPKYSASAALTVSLASLVSSSAGVGRQSALVDNTTTRYQRIYVYPKVKLGASPTANTLVSFFLIRDDGSGNRTDGAGATDAGITLTNAVCIGTLTTGASPSTGTVLQGDFLVEDPGPKWAIAAVNGTGVALDATGASHAVTWVGEDPEYQN